MPILILQMQTHGGNINGKQLLGGFCALDPQNKIHLVFSNQCWRKCQGWSMHLLILQRCPKLLTFCTLIRKATQTLLSLNSRKFKTFSTGKIPEFVKSYKSKGILGIMAIVTKNHFYFYDHRLILNYKC